MAGESIFDETFAPFAIVKEAELDHNISTFASYCREHSLELAPHVKTTMSPQIFARQREAGAWAATVATVAQAEKVARWAVDRVLIAGQIVDRAGLRWLAKSTRQGAEVYCWVDSLKGLQLIETAHRDASAFGPIRLLVELGHEGGRSGCRTPSAAVSLAEAVEASDSTQLCGLAAFEGTIPGGRSAIAAVDELLDEACAVTSELLARGLIGSSEAIVTVGGSAYFDRVADKLAAIPRKQARVVLRSGCYVTHDCGIYDELSPLGSSSANVLRPALEVWGAVLSVPEHGLAIANFGRRDVSFDAGLPRITRTKRGATDVVDADPQLAVTALNDQHAYVADPRSSLQVGDLIGACTSHPCTTFDKWRELPLVDQDYRQTGAIATEF